MRIAMISTPFVSAPPSSYGGTELIVHELVEGLIQRGHDVTLFATGDSRSGADLRWYFERPQWPPETFADLTHVGRALREIANGHFDIVHAHSAVAVAMAQLLPGVPLVYTIHHDRDEKLSSYYAAHPDIHYVAISADQQQREIVLPHSVVIHHGVDPHVYSASADADDYVCFVGRFSPVKGPHTAIDAATAAGSRIVMAGEVHEPDREFADRELAWRLSLSNVQYIGCIGMDLKRPLLRDARALLAPIEWNEPFGLALIEAMFSGCPVVAFPRGSVFELVESGVTGFIVESQDEMTEVIRPGGPLESFDRLRCRRRAVERFSSLRMVRDYERLYKSAVYMGEERSLDTAHAAA